MRNGGGGVRVNPQQQHRSSFLQPPILRMEPESMDRLKNNKQNNESMDLQRNRGNTKQQAYSIVNNNKNDEDDESVPMKISDSFDGAGFANYLAPYALALLASVLVTLAFFKFVLLDY
jgi:hypothetical protein